MVVNEIEAGTAPIVKLRVGEIVRVTEAGRIANIVAEKVGVAIREMDA